MTCLWWRSGGPPPQKKTYIMSWPKGQRKRACTYLFYLLSYPLSVLVAQLNFDSNVYIQGFFPGGLGVPPRQKFCLSPPTDCRPRFLIRAYPPQLSFVPENFKYLTSFYSQFWLLFSPKLHSESSILCLKVKTPTFALIKGHFWPQRTIFPSPPSSNSVPDTSSPLIWPRPQRGPKSCPRKQAPPSTKNFVKITLICKLASHST